MGKKARLTPKIKLYIAVAVVIALVIAASIGVRSFFGNMTLFDTTYDFGYAQVKMPDGSIVEGRVEGWHDYGDSDMIQVTINGETYFTHSANAVLIANYKG